MESVPTLEKVLVTGNRWVKRLPAVAQVRTCGAIDNGIN